MKFILSFAVVLAFLLSVAAESVILTGNHTARSEIIVSPDAPAEIKEAAAALRFYIQRISDAEVAVVDRPGRAAGIAAIWVGKHPDLDVPEADLNWREDEEYLIMVKAPGDIVLAGKDVIRQGRLMESGTVSAVYIFIQDYLRVRWLWPGELGTDIIRRETIELPETLVRNAPAIKQRALRLPNSKHLAEYFQRGRTPIMDNWQEKQAKSAQEVLQWLHFQRAGQASYDRPASGSFSMAGGHAFTDWWTRFGKTHPEYFAMRPDGTRTVPIPRFAKLCVSNPAVLEQVVQDLERRLPPDKKQPAILSASPNDGGGYCMCPGCLAMDEPDAPKLTFAWLRREMKVDEMNLAVAALEEEGDYIRMEYVFLTDRYAKFWNRIMAKLRQRHPDRDISIGVWAYHACRTPPVRTRLDDNIVVGYVGLGSLTENISPDAQQEHLREWKGWAGKCRRIIWRPNLYWLNWGFPYIYMQRSAEHIRTLADNHMIGMDIDTLPLDFAAQGIQYYLLAQLAWNPRADVNDLINDYTLRAFGPAAASMRRYYEVFEGAGKRYELYHDTGRGKGAGYFTDQVYTPECMAAANDALTEAAGLVKGLHPYEERVAFVQVGYEWTAAQLGVIRARKALRQPGISAAAKKNVAQQIIKYSQARDLLLRENFGNHALSMFNMAFYEKLTALYEMTAVSADMAPPDLAILDAAK